MVGCPSQTDRCSKKPQKTIVAELGERRDHLQWEKNLSAFLPAEVTGINESLSRDTFGWVSPLGTDSRALTQEHFHTQQWIFPETSPTLVLCAPIQSLLFLYWSQCCKSIFQLLRSLMPFRQFFLPFPNDHFPSKFLILYPYFIKHRIM